MKSKTVRIEQEEANTKEIDRILNREIEKLIKEGYSIKDYRIAVGRDADKNSGIKLRYSITIIIMYD